MESVEHEMSRNAIWLNTTSSIIKSNFHWNDEKNIIEIKISKIEYHYIVDKRVINENKQPRKIKNDSRIIFIKRFSVVNACIESIVPFYKEIKEQ